MTLAEAIAHEDWAATTAHGELADEHAQMRDWLRELERLRSARDMWQENDAKLRELVKQMRPRAKAFLQMCVQLGCTDTLSYDWELQMHELGIEVDE